MASLSSYISGAALTTLCRYLKTAEPNKKELIEFLESRTEVTGARVQDEERFFLPNGSTSVFIRALTNLQNAAQDAHGKNGESPINGDLYAADFGWQFGKQIGI